MGRAKTRARGTAKAGRAQACNHMSTSDAVFMLHGIPFETYRGTSGEANSSHILRVPRSGEVG